MNFCSISRNGLVEASKAALKNCKDFQFEANLLYKMRNYGHSQSLAVLGIEEFGKHIGYGILAFEKVVNIKGRIQYDPDELLSDLQRNHISKQNIAIMFTVLSNFTSFERSELKRILDQDSKVLEYNRSKKKFDHFADITDNYFTIKKWSKDFELINNLEAIKQNGFYVSLNGNDNINIPSSNDARMSKKINQLLKKLMQSYTRTFY